MANNTETPHAPDAAEEARLKKRDDGSFPRNAIDARQPDKHAGEMHQRVKDAAAQGHFSQATVDHVGKMVGSKK